MTADEDTQRTFRTEPTPQWQALMVALDTWIDTLERHEDDRSRPKLSEAELEYQVGAFIRALEYADSNCDGEKDDPAHPLDVVLYPHRLEITNTGGQATYLKCPYCGRLNTNGISR